VHGRDRVVVVSEEEFRRLQGRPTGQALIDAMQASPYKEIDLDPSDIFIGMHNKLKRKN
jgi:hypothetical protein